MSRYHRRNGLWPADEIGAQVWHLVAALEDVADLVEASKHAADFTVKAAVMKKALVELKSFDELVGEFQGALKKGSGKQLQEDQRRALESALSTYHRAAQPSRELLADIRNTLAAHRRSLPDERQRERFGEDFRTWGAWEQHLVDLEDQCMLERWLTVINAAIALRNVVAEASPGSWFSITQNGLKVYLPLQMEPAQLSDDDKPAG